MTIVSIAGSYSHESHGYILVGLGSDSKPYRWDEKTAQWVFLNEHAWNQDAWTLATIAP